MLEAEGFDARGHHAVMVRNRQEALQLMESLGVSPEGRAAMQGKAEFRLIRLKDVECKAANIIKQEMLAVGAEAAVSRKSVYASGVTDVLLMGTMVQHRQVLKVLHSQPFGLNNLALEVEHILSSFEAAPPVMQLPGGARLNLAERTHIMGILNVTPDSFSDGGRYLEPVQALERALEMKEEGADIIDVGAVSSRPGSELADESEELRRIMPVLEKLAGHDLIISIDTFRGRVASEALACGAHIINDIGALQLDKDMLPVLSDSDAPVILMHNRLQKDQEKPYIDMVSDICTELKSIANMARSAGIGKERLILDPGIGFGKNPAENCLLVEKLAEFKSLGYPLLVGASRKRFIGHVLGLEVDERLEGSLAVLVLSIANGASIIRVHDVRASKRAAMMADSVVGKHGQYNS